MTCAEVGRVMDPWVGLMRYAVLYWLYYWYARGE
jgi:hypothetical protein